MSDLNSISNIILYTGTLPLRGGATLSGTALSNESCSN